MSDYEMLDILGAIAVMLVLVVINLCGVNYNLRKKQVIRKLRLMEKYEMSGNHYLVFEMDGYNITIKTDPKRFRSVNQGDVVPVKYREGLFFGVFNKGLVTHQTHPAP